MEEVVVAVAATWPSTVLNHSDRCSCLNQQSSDMHFHVLGFEILGSLCIVLYHIMKRNFFPGPLYNLNFSCVTIERLIVYGTKQSLLRMAALLPHDP